MSTKFRLSLGLLTLAPALANALGLGDIRLGSALNQPMAADIEIVGATAEELTQLRATLPARDIFVRYGVDRPQFLSALSFTIAKDTAGRPAICAVTIAPCLRAVCTPSISRLPRVWMVCMASVFLSTSRVAIAAAVPTELPQ